MATSCPFCVVNLQFYGQAMEVPYVSALILIDGSDIPLMHLIQEAKVEDVHMGMRVQAVWVPEIKTVELLGPPRARPRHPRPPRVPRA